MPAYKHTGSFIIIITFDLKLFSFDVTELFLSFSLLFFKIVL